MRGTLKRNAAIRSAQGIIPAYAGNTMALSLATMDWRDHPRVCGEHVFLERVPAGVAGSSPRMRGTPSWKNMEGEGLRIIPAYAGNTFDWPWLMDWTRDHPRVCGEHRFYNPQTVSNTGSSPRMRGTRAKQQILLCYVGIIPAYAGNTCSKMAPVAVVRDHPRVCGEHTLTPGLFPPVGGSSPRMRGTLELDSPLRFF